MSTGAGRGRPPVADRPLAGRYHRGMKRRSTPVNYTEAASVSQPYLPGSPRHRQAGPEPVKLEAMTRTSDQVPPRPAEQLRADARQNHARLIAAATTAFAERGADAPLEDVARRAGVGIGTLYRHFPTRLDLQAAVFRSQVGAVCGEGDALLEKAPPGEAFGAWMRSLAGYLVTKRGLSHALIEAVGIESELISSCWVAMRQTTERLLANAQEAGVIRPDVDATDVMRLVHGVTVSTEKAPERSDMLLSVMLDGLRATPS
jgi:AcrR family transcriptional regulator